jgi:hypothetical protein
MIGKLKSGKISAVFAEEKPKTGKRRNPGTFKTKTAAKKQERAIEDFKRH